MKRLPDLGTALAMKLDSAGVVAYPEDWTWKQPDLADLSESIGAGLGIKEWGNLWCYCWWRYEEDAEEPVLSAVASIETPKRDIRDQRERALKAVDARVARDGWELWIERILTPDAFGDFETPPDELLSDFVASLAKAKARLKP